MAKVFAHVSKIQQPYDDDVYQIFSYRQMKGVMLTKREALMVGMQLLAIAGVDGVHKGDKGLCAAATSTSE